MTYLNPKADLAFKKVFGEHPDLVISFLNALLPLEKGEEIKSIEYLPSEMVPEHPLRRFSIVDVRCVDNNGRQFIVEMQMIWSPEFQYRVSFSESNAYVRQANERNNYDLLQPVYSLNFVNDVIEPKLNGYYHHYREIHVESSDRVIGGLQLVFVELPKFTPHTVSEKKMHVLWLRYLTEINDKTREIPEELLESPEIKKAVKIIEESAFTPEQLLGYEKFWDIVSVEKTLISSAERKGFERGMAIGREVGLAKGRMLVVASRLKKQGIPLDVIVQSTNLTIEEIEKL